MTCSACKRACFKVTRDKMSPPCWPDTPFAGKRVKFNGGFDGTILKVHGGQLSGMVDVRGERGVVCIPIADLR